MTDAEVTFATLDYEHGERFQTLRRELGVSAFGVNLLLFEPRERARIHSHDQQEEVYLVLAGELTLVVERVEHLLGPKRIARVPRGVRRQLVNAGPERLVLLALGGGVSEELYLVSAGRGRLLIDGEERIIGEGDCALIAPGARHELFNAGSDPLRVVCACSPAYSDEDTCLTE